MSLSEYQKIFATILDLGADLELQPGNLELQAQIITYWGQLAGSEFYTPNQLQELRTALLVGAGLDINLLLSNTQDQDSPPPIII